MKKVIKIFGIIIICIGIITIIIFNIFGLKEIDNTKIKQINFISMPSPPKIKTINDNKEIEAIINIINKSRKNFCGFYTAAGWQGVIELQSGEKITLLDNLIIYNNFKYRLTDKEYKKLFSIYEKSNVVEKVYK